jgi:hypothetical protein
LEHDDELEAAAFEPPSDLHHFAKARMESVGDTGFSRLFVGSMSPFRAHCEPVGTVRLPVGKHGSMKPGGCKDMEQQG